MSRRDDQAETNNEIRYFALLALTSQELPRPPSNLRVRYAVGGESTKDEALYERLDAEPAELERFIRRELDRIVAVRDVRARGFGARALDWLRETTHPARYAMAASLVGIVAVSIFVATRPSSIQSVEQAFVDLPRGDATQLVLPWEHPHDALGFAPPRTSRGAVAFGRGLLRARSQLGVVAVENRIEDSSDVRDYVALGEWNVFLWTAAHGESVQRSEFWAAQLDLVDKLAARKYFVEDQELIRAHLARLRTALASMQNATSPRRAQLQLTEELSAFREQFAPQSSEGLR